ncbi:MAG: helix-turn-helix transcriptional regulator [Gemmatimonadota bacterium]|nr:helix-turn-helix transcriptional regulator [Gemmatimonadota bacterium]
MGKRDSLGEFEILILAALVRLGDRAYGAAVFREVEERTGRSIAMGAVYTTLYRLEEKRLISSELGDPTPTRGGRAKRYFSIEAAGVEAIERSVGALEAMLADTRLAWGAR